MTKEKAKPPFELITGVEDKPRKVIVYGTPCIGKSSLAEQFPDPIFIQTENAGGSIACPRLPLCKTYDDFYTQLRGVFAGDYGEYKTVVIDSLKFFEKLLTRKVCEQRGITSLDDVDYGKAYGDAMSLWYDFTDMLDKFVESGFHVVLIGHNASRVIKDARVDEYETTGLDLMVWGKTYDPARMLVYWSDCVFYLARKLFTKSKSTGIGGERVTATSTGERLIYTDEQPAFLAKNRFDMPPELPFEKGNGYNVIKQYLTINKD